MAPRGHSTRRALPEAVGDDALQHKQRGQDSRNAPTRLGSFEGARGRVHKSVRRSISSGDQVEIAAPIAASDEDHRSHDQAAANSMRAAPRYPPRRPSPEQSG